jgi:probable F420-dependent oxidoreductase
MRLGVVFPQTEIGNDPAVVRDYAQAAESLGYAHILAFDHVLGGNAATHTLRGPYKHTDGFHEPFVLFGYLAGLTQKIEFVTGIIILPQRQTAVVAKQAAALDVLSGGRLRLGVGIGWNHVEYEALGMNYSDRGRRIEEQVDVMRQLWTNELITFEGRDHKITDAGLNPLPIQQPIPLWFGGHADAVLQRIGRIGDGWFPLLPPNDKGAAELEKLRGYIREAGRDPSDVGIETWLDILDKTPEQWAEHAAGWKKLGATHYSVNTMGAGLKSPAAHIDAIERIKNALSDV